MATPIAIESPEDTSHAPALNLYVLIFIEGFVTISIEILAIRQLIPFVGNSVVVTSLIIGIFLLFLAMGYRRGGRYRHDFREALLRNFTKSALWLGMGLSYSFVSLFFIFMYNTVVAYPLVSLCAYLLLVIAPLIYWLGQTIPITTNLYTQGHSVGEISGYVLFLNTLGSFLGAIVTSLIFLNYIGVAGTIIINFCLLLLLSVLLFRSISRDLTRLFILLAGFFLVYALNIGVERNLFIGTNQYANYQVQDNFEITPGNQGKVFVVNNSLSSFLNEAGQGAPYIEFIKQILFSDLELKDKQILVIGAGGFTLSAQGSQGNEITYIDIDKQITDFAQSFIAKIQGRFIAEDARVYLNKQHSSYDVIISDAYNNPKGIPAYLLSYQHILHIRQALTPDGLAVFNIIANPFLEDAYSKRIDNTISAVFENCMRIPMQYSNQLTNIIYLCKKSPQEYDKIVYTDNINRADLDYFSSGLIA